MIIFPIVLKFTQIAAALENPWPPTSWIEKVPVRKAIAPRPLVKKSPKFVPYTPPAITKITYSPSDNKLQSFSSDNHWKYLWAIRKAKEFEMTMSPEYDKIDTLESAGNIEQADNEMLKLYDEDADGKNRLGMYHMVLMGDLEKRGEFSKIFDMCVHSASASIPMLVLEAGCGAHLGLVFKGEREFLRSVAQWKLPETLSQQEVDRGEDPKSIELFAWFLYSGFPGDIGGHSSGPGCGDGENTWANKLAYKLLPQSDDLFVSLVLDSCGTNPQFYYDALKKRFPNGYPKHLEDTCHSIETACYVMIAKKQVWIPTKYQSPRYRMHAPKTP